MKPLLGALLLGAFSLLSAQDLAGDPPAVGPANLMEVLWALPVSHAADDALLISFIEWNFGCDKYPQSLVGLWDRFVCHANHWAKMRRDQQPDETISWQAFREWRLVKESFHDVEKVVANE